MTKYTVDKDEWVDINGDRQNIHIRTTDTGHPVILFLHGGPGIPDRNWVMHYQSGLADDYTMVLWDQRASGKSWHPDSKKQELHVEQYIADAKAMVEYLCDKFQKEKIIVAGHSWGTVIGTPLAARYPEHIAAYIGQGQFVEGAQNELISYEFCLKEAKKRGDRKALRKLEGNAPVNGSYPTHKAMMAQRDCLSRYGGAAYKESGGVVQSLVIPFITMEGYHLKDLPGYAKGALYLTDVLWPEVVSHDFFQEAGELKVPVLLTIGRHDYNTPFALAEQWFGKLQAPYKKLVWFSESAHSPIKEEPERWGRKVREFLENPAVSSRIR